MSPRSRSQPATLGTVENPQRGEGGGRFGGGDRVGIDVERGGLPQETDHRAVRDHVSPVDRQGLAQRPDQHVRRECSSAEHPSRSTSRMTTFQAKGSFKDRQATPCAPSRWRNPPRSAEVRGFP